MPGVINRNLRYLLWREGVDRRNWSAQLAEWLCCSEQRARVVMEAGSLIEEEIKRISEVLNIEGDELLFRDFLEEAHVDVLRENLRYLIRSPIIVSQKELAFSVGVHPTKVSRWLKDQRPEDGTLTRLAYLFGLRPDTDLKRDPIFLSSGPIGEMERKAWLKKRIDEMNSRKLNELFPALKLLLEN